MFRPPFPISFDLSRGLTSIRTRTILEFSSPSIIMLFIWYGLQRFLMNRSLSSSNSTNLMFFLKRVRNFSKFFALLPMAMPSCPFSTTNIIRSSSTRQSLMFALEYLLAIFMYCTVSLEKVISDIILYFPFLTSCSILDSPSSITAKAETAKFLPHVYPSSTPLEVYL